MIMLAAFRSSHVIQSARGLKRSLKLRDTQRYGHSGRPTSSDGRWFEPPQWLLSPHLERNQEENKNICCSYRNWLSQKVSTCPSKHLSHSQASCTSFLFFLSFRSPTLDANCMRLSRDFWYNLPLAEKPVSKTSPRSDWQRDETSGGRCVFKNMKKKKPQLP